MRQVELRFRTWGGKRKGAGRKSARASTPHTARPSVSRHHPLHVTLRMAGGLPSLRSEVVVRALRKAFENGRERFGMRLVHYSVQGNHLHLIVEAADKRALTRGMHGLDIRIARAVNAVLGRSGPVLGDRYHARALTSPREVRNVLAYVLLNGRRHGSASAACDLASSAACFDGWSKSPAVPEETTADITRTRAPPETWLLRVGWRRRGLIDPSEKPGPHQKKGRASLSG